MELPRRQIFHGYIKSNAMVARELEVREAGNLSGYGWGLWE